jgi:hypothetical protein
MSKPFKLILDRNLVVDAIEKPLYCSSLVGFCNPNLEHELIPGPIALSPAPVVIPHEKGPNGEELFLVLQRPETWQRELSCRNFSYVRCTIVQPRNETHRQLLLWYFQKVRAARCVTPGGEVMASFRLDRRLVDMVREACFLPYERPGKGDIAKAICGMSRSTMYTRTRKKAENMAEVEVANSAPEQGSLLDNREGNHD